MDILNFNITYFKIFNYILIISFVFINIFINKVLYKLFLKELF